MAEDNALRLISKVISGQDIVPVLERGITPEWFPVEEHRSLFAFIHQYYRRYGVTPTAVTVKDNFPTARLLRVLDPIDYLIDQMVDWRRRMGTIALIRQATDQLEDGNHEGAIRAIASGIIRIESDTSVKSTDLDLTADPQARWTEYLERVERGTSLLGLPTGFPTIDMATAGIQSGQLITIVATPKAGKSTLALKIATHIHALGHVPFFQSFEMSNTEQRNRHDAMRAMISHARLIRGTLRSEEETKLQRMLHRMQDAHQFILSDAAEGLTLSAVQAKLTKYQPEAAFIDGVYLMHDEITGERNTPQALTNITRGFKALAQRNKIPIVITTQALLWKMRGTKVAADSIGYSSSFFQDSDTILGLELLGDDDGGDEHEGRKLKVVASRNCGPAETDLDWDWDRAVFAELGVAA